MLKFFRGGKRIKKDGGIEYYIYSPDGSEIVVEKEIYDPLSQEFEREKKFIQRHGIQQLSFEFVYESDSKDEDCSLLDFMSSQEFPDPEAGYLQKETIAELYQAISRLSDAEKELIHYIFFEEWTVREYAEKLGKPHTSVQYRKKKILEKLKNEMQKNF